MKVLLYVISVFWIASGACMVLYTPEFRNVIRSFLKSMDRRVLAVLPAVFGVLLMAAASVSRNAWFVRLLGVIGLAKGGFIFTNPKGYYDQMLDWYLDQASDQTYRFFGIIALILGTALFSWIL
jgi:hypothetical protein